jgi:hypothetical protein
MARLPKLNASNCARSPSLAGKFISAEGEARMALPDGAFARLLQIVRDEDGVRIPVGDQFALVDEADASIVSKHGWRLHKSPYTSYAVATIDGVITSMHKLILGGREGMIVDHEDGDGLNNRRSNLRHCTHAQNMKNRHSTTGVSRFKGVWRDRVSWRATIWADKRKINLGSFSTEKRAARAYDRAAPIYHGQFARTNADLGLL